MNYDNEQHRAQTVEGLRQLADFIENVDPTIPLPAFGTFSCYGGSVLGPDGQAHDIDSKMGMALIAARVRSLDKSADASFFRLRRNFSAGISIEWVAYRNAVCIPRVVGKRMVEAQPEVRETKITAAVEAHEEDVVEWDCPTLLSIARGASVEIPVEQTSLPAPAPAAAEESFIDSIDGFPF